jgi:hypothetical protein
LIFFSVKVLIQNEDTSRSKRESKQYSEEALESGQTYEDASKTETKNPPKPTPNSHYLNVFCNRGQPVEAQESFHQPSQF